MKNFEIDCTLIDSIVLDDANTPDHPILTIEFDPFFRYLIAFSFGPPVEDEEDKDG